MIANKNPLPTRCSRFRISKTTSTSSLWRHRIILPWVRYYTTGTLNFVFCHVNIFVGEQKLLLAYLLITQRLTCYFCTRQFVLIVNNNNNNNYLLVTTKINRQVLYLINQQRRHQWKHKRFLLNRYFATWIVFIRAKFTVQQYK